MFTGHFSVWERLAGKFTVDTESGCWLWTGCKNKKGYGRFWYLGKGVDAYVVVYELLIGVIPKGLELDHTCKNPACVNPSHLEPVVRAVNVRRGRAAKLDAKSVEEIRRLYATGEKTYRELGLLFGVSWANIGYVVQNQTWKD